VQETRAFCPLAGVSFCDTVASHENRAENRTLRFHPLPCRFVSGELGGRTAASLMAAKGKRTKPAGKKPLRRRAPQNPADHGRRRFTFSFPKTGDAELDEQVAENIASALESELQGVTLEGVADTNPKSAPPTFDLQKELGIDLNKPLSEVMASIGFAKPATDAKPVLAKCIDARRQWLQRCHDMPR
jgi:hypothetical protein